MSEPRNKSITAKVTDQEYASLHELAAASGQNLSEFGRMALLDKLNPSPATAAETAILAEILAARSIIINLLQAHSEGERLSVEHIRAVMAEADAAKWRTARKRLQLHTENQGEGE